jgi:hypothetical protein
MFAGLAQQAHKPSEKQHEHDEPDAVERLS